MDTYHLPPSCVPPQYLPSPHEMHRNRDTYGVPRAYGAARVPPGKSTQAVCLMASMLKFFKVQGPWDAPEAGSRDPNR